MNPLSPPARLDAARLVRASGSSFVPAFRLLRRERRQDLEIFYAFCRWVDDLADAGDHPQTVRYEALEAWRQGLRDPQLTGLPDNLQELIRRRHLSIPLLLELLDGTATDLAAPVRMATRADLDLYCHRVAGTVGQLCLPIFGADAIRAAPYAETLGRALQYTNILRDTASDAQRNRLYYPLDELAAHGLTAETFATRENERQAYLQHFAGRTADLYDKAAKLTPPKDRPTLRPARVMAAIYGCLLGKMRKDGLRVTERRYRLTAWEKLRALLRAARGAGQ